MMNISFFNKSQIKQIVSLSLEAGEIAKKSFQAKDFEIMTKEDGSKVTSCDIEISKFFCAKLSEIFSYPIICEESLIKEVEGENFFLIDPIDGTSSFIKGSDEFCINLAFVQNGKATFGLIYAPLFEGGKLIFCDENNNIIDGINNKILRIEDRINSEIRIITSGRSKDIDIQNSIKKFYPNQSESFSIQRLSSAIKFIKILEGKSDLYIHLRPSMEWDTASGQALLIALGGKVFNISLYNNDFNFGLEMEYKKDGFRNGPFIAYLKEIT